MKSYHKNYGVLCLRIVKLQIVKLRNITKHYRVLYLHTSEKCARLVTQLADCGATKNHKKKKIVLNT